VTGALPFLGETTPAAVPAYPDEPLNSEPLVPLLVGPPPKVVFGPPPFCKFDKKLLSFIKLILPPICMAPKCDEVID